MRSSKNCLGLNYHSNGTKSRKNKILLSFIKNRALLDAVVKTGNSHNLPYANRKHQLLIQAALATPHIETEPRPFVLQTKLDDWYVVYQINAYTRHPEQMALIYSSLHQNIQDLFNEAGIEIMSPHFMGVRQTDQVFMPEEYLKNKQKE